jgi:hypothetical protein
MKVTGFDAISFAEQEGMTLNKDADHIDEARTGLSIAEAEAIATLNPNLIWLEVLDNVYYGEQRNMEPER